MAEHDESEPAAAPAGLAAAPPPGPGAQNEPALLESYVRAAVHRDRTPGAVLAVCHPLRMYKVPRGLLDAVAGMGFEVRVVETLPDRVASVTAIRDALLELAALDKPLDVVVFSGDGSLDHHVLVAAFWAFYPELVRQRPGEISTSPPTPEELAALDPDVVRTFLSPLPDGAGLQPDANTIHRLWMLRSRVARRLRRGQAPWRIASAIGLAESDPVLRLAVAAALLPHRVRLRPHGFDLEGLSAATQEQSFQGLYPFVRSIAVYPAGTAADNALYAGIPGWSFAQAAKWFDRTGWLSGLRARWEARTLRRFLEVFAEGVVVPARFSVVAFDGDWQVLSSHTVGGPAAGRFFAPDLEAKTGGLLGYLARIPSVVVGEGLLGNTRVAVRGVGIDGQTRVAKEGRLVEGLFTNRAFIAGVGSVPSCNPTSFAGASSLVLGPPLWYRNPEGRLVFDLSGLMTFIESIAKGVVGRALHLVGIGAGRLAGGGRFTLASPENQINLTEGEAIEVAFRDPSGRPRFVPTQVSGDPFQAAEMTIRVAWGPLPLLAAPGSLLLAAAQRALTRLRHLQTWHLRTIYIGGVPFYRHRVGEEALPEGLFHPLLTLPRSLEQAQRVLLSRWERMGQGPFVDTTEQGLAMGRRGRHAHDNDQTAHLVMLRERGSLLVRLIRRSREEQIFESRTVYRAGWGGWIIHDHQVRRWDPGDEARLLQEEHYFRSADAFRLEAPGFFPFLEEGGGRSALPEVDDEPEVGAGAGATTGRRSAVALGSSSEEWPGSGPWGEGGAGGSR